MTMHDAQFERELEIYRTEAEAGIQFFYAYLAVHAVAANNQSVYQLLNAAPLFWNTSLGALQTAAFIALGRVFDQNSTHNLDRLLRVAQDNPQIFSKTALGCRKQGANPDPPAWLEDYLSDVHEPTPQDFRRLRRHVRKWRKIYVSNYRDLRHKLFAHKEVSDRTETDALLAKTDIRELQRMFAFLGALHEALWQLFFNGRKPVLRPQRYSVQRIRDLPSPARRSNAVQERIIHEAEQFLVALAGITPQHVPGDRQ
jgi:hypothetical protein